MGDRIVTSKFLDFNPLIRRVIVRVVPLFCSPKTSATIKIFVFCIKNIVSKKIFCRPIFLQKNVRKGT